DAFMGGDLRIVRTSTNQSLPVVTSFNRTGLDPQNQFGQSIPAITSSRILELSGGDPPTRQDLVGLSNDADRLAYFGVTNAAAVMSTFKARAYDANGVLLGQSGEETLAPYGQRQFQREEMEAKLGVLGVDDFRIEIEVAGGGPVSPYAANVRLGTDDPAFLMAGDTTRSRQYLVGVLTKDALAGSTFEADAVLYNPSGVHDLPVELTFLPVGPNSEPTDTLGLTLGPKEVRRLPHVLRSQWGLADHAGVLVVDSVGAGGQFPVAQAEIYDEKGPFLRYGEALAPRYDSNRAGAGKRQVLAGVRQDALYRTTLWLFNPSSTPATVNLVYRRLDGSVMGREDGYPVHANGARQVGPGQLKLPLGFSGAFTVHLEVVSGQLIGAAQVVHNHNNDITYVAGQTR
ncbi:MAG TPA: hypothetical protein VMT16_08330, partial [Thermoanaerobaculia bacterium]|nr:hypothetical protein [Thermoanaerobaculia bacterium]